MKRGLLFFTLFLFAFASPIKLHAQLVGQLYSLVYYGGNVSTPGGTFNIFDPIDDSDWAPFEFNGLNGFRPYGNLVQNKTGLLYGMTNYGGTLSGGVLFSYDLKAKNQNIIYNFGADTGKPSIPYGTLVLAPDNNYYALDWYGGYAGSGTIFKFHPPNTVTKMWSLWGFEIGSSPTGNLIVVTDSLLYGMCDYSKGGGPGSIFSYNIYTNQAKLLYVFTGTSGNYPRGSLLKVNDTMLYGLTQSGGSSSDGVLFSYNIRTNVETVLHNFTGKPDGRNPGGSLMMATDGNLYGTTESGGTGDSGTLFRYNINSNTETVIYNFGLRSGFEPFADVIQATNGLLYGNCNFGGTINEGTIFSYNIGSSLYSVLFNYDGPRGAQPYANFLEVMGASDTVVENPCPGDSSGKMTVYVRGGIAPLTYHWSNGATTSSITGLKYGIDSCTVTDSRGIAFTLVDSVGPAPMGISFNVSNACNGGGGGSAWVTVLGGSGPFTYYWSNTSTTDTVTNLAVGTYTCTITDANGCSGKGTVVITQAAVMMIDSIVQTPQTCPTCYNGSIRVFVSGGVPPGDTACYYYLWGSLGRYSKYNSDTLSNLDSGSYSVCITSCYGCGSLCRDTTVATGINTLQNGGFVHIYPVPSSGLFTVDLKGNGYTNMEITDALGRNVYSQSLPPDIKNNKLLIDLSSLSDGIYVLQVRSEKGILTGKIVLQK